MYRYFVFSLIFLLSSLDMQGQRTIVGKVTDCYDEPIPGATIYLSEKRKGKIQKTPAASSDINGNYSILVSNEVKYLRFRSFGSEELRVEIKDKDTINVQLKDLKDDFDAVVYKPVIYLYPSKKTDISLKVHFNGHLDFTYPTYKNGWNVTAQPNGKLVDKADGREHNYLFWDGQMNFTKEQTTYTSGFVVHKDSLVAFFQKYLPQMGLQPHEYNDFIVFWTPLMQKNEWNFVYFRTGAGYDIVSINDVNPKPDTEIRVFMDFAKMEKPMDIPAQTFKMPERKGFTLVEWGGADVGTARFPVPRFNPALGKKLKLKTKYIAF